MTTNEQQVLIAFGESIDVQVMPIEECGINGVRFMDSATIFDYGRAMRELQIQAMSLAQCFDGVRS